MVLRCITVYKFNLDYLQKLLREWVKFVRIEKVQNQN